MGDVENHQLRYKSNRQNLVIRFFAETYHNATILLNKWKNLSHISYHMFAIYGFLDKLTNLVNEQFILRNYEI